MSRAWQAPGNLSSSWSGVWNAALKYSVASWQMMLDHALKSVVRTPFMSKLHLTQKIDDFSIGPRMVRAMAWTQCVFSRSKLLTFQGKTQVAKGR